jgi:hypothetical protein
LFAEFAYFRAMFQLPSFTRMIFLSVLVATGVFISSCEKEPGFGGLATITGKVYAFDYNPAGSLIGEGYTGDIEVFISVEGQPGVLDRIRTSFDGSYIFTQLRKGSYVIWVFSDCDICTDNKEPVSQIVKVNSNRQEITLEDFRIRI